MAGCHRTKAHSPVNAFSSGSCDTIYARLLDTLCPLVLTTRRGFKICPSRVTLFSRKQVIRGMRGGADQQIVSSQPAASAAAVFLMEESGGCRRALVFPC